MFDDTDPGPWTDPQTHLDTDPVNRPDADPDVQPDASAPDDDPSPAAGDS
jgi:hypothetical protein